MLVDIAAHSNADASFPFSLAPCVLVVSIQQHRETWHSIHYQPPNVLLSLIQASILFWASPTVSLVGFHNSTQNFSCNLFLDVSNNIHLEAIMNIPEWQAKMIRSSPKSIMKHANKQLELLGVLNDENGNIKETAKAHLPSDEKKVRKGNIDLLTGKRKYTKKLLKFDGVLSNSKFVTLFSWNSLINFHQLPSELKERKKHKQRAGNLAFGGANPHVPRKYTFKKRIRKMNSDGISLHNYHPNEKHFEPINRSKNSSPVPHHRAEKWVQVDAPSLAIV